MATLTTPTLTTTTSGGAHARCGRRMMRVSRITNALQGVSSTRKIPNDTSALKSRNYSLSSSSLVAKATTTTSTTTTTVFRSWERRRQQQQQQQQQQKRGTMVKTAAGGGQGDAPKKITRANEAKTEAFLSPEEKAGTNPLKDPMAIIGIVGIVGVPALILLIGVTSGYIGQ